MSGISTATRPIGVSIIAILMIINAVADIFIGFMLIFSAFGDNPEFVNQITGETETASTFFLWFYGAMLIFLGLIFFWLAKLAWIGSATAQVFISVLAVINIVFGFFSLGHGGFVQVLLGLIVVLIVNTNHAKQWFTQAP